MLPTKIRAVSFIKFVNITDHAHTNLRRQQCIRDQEEINLCNNKTRLPYTKTIWQPFCYVPKCAETIHDRAFS